VKRLEDRIAVVTGAGSGIGRATCEALAREGCHVAAVDRDRTSAEVTAETVRAMGRTASVHEVDVSDRERMMALPEQILAAHGGVEIVVNNAGVTIAKSFEEHTLDDLDWIVGINFWGVVYGCRAFLPHLRAADEGHLVNLSSMAGLVGLPMQSSYCATKFAVRGLSESLSVELSGTNVGVTVVMPGPFRTKVLRSARSDGSPQTGRLADLLERHARPPSVVADRIVTAIRKRHSRVVVGVEARLSEAFQRVAPSTLLGALGWGYRKAKRSQYAPW
jgi:NAD(P)-dependent dehydrogenase (short-subunit alcohol dehydrogenase family)